MNYGSEISPNNCLGYNINTCKSFYLNTEGNNIKYSARNQMIKIRPSENQINQGENGGNYCLNISPYNSPNVIPNNNYGMYYDCNRQHYKNHIFHNNNRFNSDQKHCHSSQYNDNSQDYLYDYSTNNLGQNVMPRRRLKYKSPPDYNRPPSNERAHKLQENYGGLLCGQNTNKECFCGCPNCGKSNKKVLNRNSFTPNSKQNKHNNRYKVTSPISNKRKNYYFQDQNQMNFPNIINTYREKGENRHIFIEENGPHFKGQFYNNNNFNYIDNPNYNFNNDRCDDEYRPLTTDGGVNQTKRHHRINSQVNPTFNFNGNNYFNDYNHHQNNNEISSNFNQKNGRRNVDKWTVDTKRNIGKNKEFNINTSRAKSPNRIYHDNNFINNPNVSNNTHNPNYIKISNENYVPHNPHEKASNKRVHRKINSDFVSNNTFNFQSNRNINVFERRRNGSRRNGSINSRTRQNSDGIVNYLKNIQSISVPGINDDGEMKVNQDKAVVLTNINNIPNFHIFGVLDGHGECGENCSETAANLITSFITNHTAVTKTCETEEIYRVMKANNWRMLNEAYTKAEQHLTNYEFDSERSGTTCCLVIQVGKHLICANTGDSRAILVYEEGKEMVNPSIIRLSRDQKPDLPGERARIERLGGVVDQCTTPLGTKEGPLRVWEKDKEYPGIAMSRSIGDRNATKIGVVPDPEVTEYEVNEGVKYILICSDGIWEFLSNEEVMDICNPFYLNNDPTGLCKDLSEKAKNLWLKEEDAVDDITVVTAFY